MDPISLAVLAALAGGAGGEIGRQAWAGLSGVVRRRRAAATAAGDGDGGSPGGAAGESPQVTPAGSPAAAADGPPDAAATSESALAALEERPDDLARAGELERALTDRRAADAEFARAVQVWEASFRATLSADPDAAADLERAVRAISPEAAPERAAGVHNDFRDGKFDGPVQGSGTQHITYNK
ncbi:hypothetical protein ACWF94_12340 [Streptomyces sp. NPDC055078]